MNKTTQRLASTLTVLCTMCIAPVSLQAQHTPDPIVMEVGGQQVHQSEFLKEYQENVGRQLQNKAIMTQAERQQSLIDYAELYATFLAKVQDAKSQGYDTTARLRRELAHYRKDLAAPYLIDSVELDRLMREAYERNHYSLRAAHILVSFPRRTTPEDTLKCYQEAWKLYNRIQAGEKFEDIAYEHYHKLNPAEQNPANLTGELGYFGVFDMLYPFECGAYSLKVGEVSKPVRTRYGYHIIKLLDKVEGISGQVSIAHIWLSSRDSASRAEEINTMYRDLQTGRKFEQLARQSDDRSTAEKGGLIENAQLSQLLPEYVHALSGMKVGEYSKPFYSRYGWHIVKLVYADTLLPLERMEGYYKQRMARDQRGSESRRSFAAHARTKYGIVDYTTVPVPQPKGKRGSKKAEPKMMANLNEVINGVSDSLYTGRWVMDETLFTDTTTLVSTPTKRYRSIDFARYIAKNQQLKLRINQALIVPQYYADFVDSVTIDYADSQLEQENPEFARIVDEYRRGLMIFNYNDANIWRKAQEDSVGFSEFFARESAKKDLNNPEDSIYFYHPRARVTLVDVSSSNALPAPTAVKIARKALKNDSGSIALSQQLRKKVKGKGISADEVVKVDVDLVEQTRQKLLQNDEWQPGVYLREGTNGKYRLIMVEEILPRSIKGQQDARGYYLNAWQNEVEKALNDKLHAQYNVKINYNVLRNIAL